MKILTIGDPHFKVNNSKDLSVMCEKILDLIKQEHFDFIVIMGDILDRHETINIYPFTQAIQFLNQCRQHVLTFVLIGNHDRPNNSTYQANYHPFLGMKQTNNLVIIDEILHYEIKEKNFLFCPYFYPGTFQKN
jgi:DNA repair exonuclease SbcCD nuclease subunit